MSNEIKQRIVSGALKQYEESRARLVAEKAERLAQLAAAKKKNDDDDWGQGIKAKADASPEIETPSTPAKPAAEALPIQRRAVQRQRDITD